MALALASQPMSGRDERWLDLCAGPGGKSALLAALARTRGAKLLASELQHHRAGLVRRGTRAVPGGMLGVVTADGTRPPWRPGSFDRVLVDAPCSGLGALRRRPESRWRRTPGDLKQLVPLQQALLASALDGVRPGGVVAYATCSPLLPETAEIVQTVLDVDGLWTGSLRRAERSGTALQSARARHLRGSRCGQDRITQAARPAHRWRLATGVDNGLRAGRTRPTKQPATPAQPIRAEPPAWGARAGPLGGRDARGGRWTTHSPAPSADGRGRHGGRPGRGGRSGVRHVAPARTCGSMAVGVRLSDADSANGS